MRKAAEERGLWAEGLTYSTTAMGGDPVGRTNETLRMGFCRGRLEPGIEME